MAYESIKHKERDDDDDDDDDDEMAYEKKEELQYFKLFRHH